MSFSPPVGFRLQLSAEKGIEREGRAWEREVKGSHGPHSYAPIRQSVISVKFSKISLAAISKYS